MPNAMPCILPHRGKALFLTIFLNDGPNIAEGLSRPRLLDAEFRAALCHIHQALRLAIDRADGKGHAGIPYPTVVVHADIDTNDIAVTQPIFVARNTVTDHIIDGGTDGGRERWHCRTSITRRYCSIANITGDSPSTTNILLGYLVDFSGRDAWFQVWTNHFVRLSHNTPGLTQLRNLLF